MSQLSALLQKNFIEKKRNIRITVCEFCCHLLVVILLAMSYGLSEIFVHNSREYDVMYFTFPPSAIIESSTTVNGTTTYDYNVDLVAAYWEVEGILKRPLVVPTFDQFITANRLAASEAEELADAFLYVEWVQWYGNLLKEGALHFAPYPSVEVDSLINYLNTTTTTFRDMRVYKHATEDDAVEWILDNHEEDYTLALIGLREISEKKINYVIRQNVTTVPDTGLRVIYPTTYLSAEFERYILSGYLVLETTIDDWAFGHLQKSNLAPECSAPPEPIMMPFPTYRYDQNDFFIGVGFLLGLALTMATMFPTSRLVKTIVEEKETRMRETMKIMGLEDWAHQLSWLITAFILFTWIGISTTYIAKISFLPMSDTSLVFIFFMLFAMSEMALCFLVSVFFKNAKIAAVCAPVILLFLLLPKYIFFGTGDESNVSRKALASFLSPTAFAFGADIAANYEYGNVGLQYSNLHAPGYNFYTVLTMLFVDTVLYGILAWYFDQTLSSQYGRPRGWLFFLNPSYWCGRMWRKKDKEAGDAAISTQTPAAEALDPDIEPFTDLQRRALAVVVSGLRKQYSDGKLALKHLDLALVEGEITCLLGHNGAGKSTTISLLTGLYAATAGDVSIYGHSLSDELDAIRKTTGICPQMDVLFPSLTVKEHLHFFGAIKGLKRGVLSDAVDEIMADIGLTEKALTLSGGLSGGMKRKLCLAMALIGDPKFVVMDEPTSGMDPYSRRSVWEMLQRRKAGRVMLLTTHFLDEADIVSDRVAILSEGRLRCAGTSLFLKNRFGAGYVLSIARDPTQGDEATQLIVDDITATVPSAKVESLVAGEILFRLPFEVAPELRNLFAHIQAHANALGIVSFGVSITSLEQVFISLARSKPVHDDEETDPIWQQRVNNFASGVYAALRSAGDTLMCTRSPRFSEANLDKADNTLERTPTSGSIQIVVQADGVRPSDLSNATWEDETGIFRNVEELGMEETEEPYEMQFTPTGDEFGDEIEMCDKKVGGDFHHQPTLQSEVVDSSAIANVQENSTFDSVPQGPTALTHVTSIDGYENTEKASKVDGDNLAEKCRKDDDERSCNETVRSETYTGNMRVQYIELIRKRAIIASRDLQGLFFQIIFPAIQIVLIMAILTVELNPAGNVLRLNSEMFSFTPDAFVAGPNASRADDYMVNLNPRMDLSPAPDTCTNSSMMSQFLLDDYLSVHDDRYAAFVSDDIVEARINVDWGKTKRIAQTADPRTVDTVLLFVPLNTPFPIPVEDGEQSLFEDDETLDDLARAVNNTEFTEAIRLLQNATANLDDDFEVKNATVQFGAIEFRGSDRTYIFTNLTIVFNGGERTFTVANAEVQEDDLLDALPDGIEEYIVFIPTDYSIMHNASAPHGIAGFHAELRQSYFKQCFATEETPEPIYLPKNHPLPLTSRQTLENRLLISTLAVLFITIPLCYIPASFLNFLVRERVSKAKHLQIVSSVNPNLYWLAVYTWDLMLFAFLVALVMISFVGYGSSAASVFIGEIDKSMVVLCLLWSYGMSVLPQCYLYSMFFQNHSSCQITVTVVNFTTGFVGLLSILVMQEIPNTQDFAKVLVHFLRFFPTYNVGEGLIKLVQASLESTLLGEPVNVFAWTYCLRSIVFMCFEAVGYFCIVLLTEQNVFMKLNEFLIHRKGQVGAADANAEAKMETEAGAEVEAEEKEDNSQGVDTGAGQGANLYGLARITDPDVAAEDAKVQAIFANSHFEGGATGARPVNSDVEGLGVSSKSASGKVGDVDDYALVVRRLQKVYQPAFYGAKPKYALRGVSFALAPNERFGYLGVNGAGKSTTMGILTGDILPTGGDAYVAGMPLSDPRTLLSIGYCPQTDPILDLLNSYETLRFYGRIRGVPDDVLEPRIQHLVDAVGLRKHAHRSCGKYSGGNKRKLSLAVALIGDPKVILLDEPSSGMDPEARRNMWNVIAEVTVGRCVILTTHSMEECEALCSRIGIMVGGQLKCLGSSQHLKSKFGNGYEIQMNFRLGGLDESRELLADTFPTMIVQEQVGDFVRINVSEMNDLASAFGTLQHQKDTGLVLDYSIAQCSLEQVFVSFAGAAKTDDGI